MTAGGRAMGGDQRDLSPFTTADPIPETIVRRGKDGFVRALALHTALGLFQVGKNILVFPLAQAPADTFLKHTADGALQWVPPAAISGSVEFSQIINLPTSLAGYGINNAYTKAQVDAFFAALTFIDIGGTASRAQLPAAIAYEDELNVFNLLNRFQAEVRMNTLNEETADAGIVIEGMKVKDGTAPDLEALAHFISR